MSSFLKQLTETGTPQPFVLVYHADTGALNAVGHALHKMFKPATYPCSLCALTHGFATEKSSWKNLLKKYPNGFEILHLDEFHKIYPTEAGSGHVTTPCILRRGSNGALEVTLSSETIGKLPDTQALVDAMEDIIAKIDQSSSSA